MRLHAKAALTALATALLLAAAVGGAAARSFSVSNQNIRATWRSLEFQSELVTIRCPVTLEGSLAARTFPKVIGMLIARINVQRVAEGSCVNGRVTIPPGIWHVSYEAFTGSLPRITSLLTLMRMLRIRIITAFCTAEYGTESDNIFGSFSVEEGGAVTTITPVAGRNRVRLFRSESGICPTEGSVAGTGEVTAQGAIPPRIRLTLI